jgi:hypothetical protein
MLECAVALRSRGDLRPLPPETRAPLDCAHARPGGRGIEKFTERPRLDIQISEAVPVIKSVRWHLV